MPRKPAYLNVLERLMTAFENEAIEAVDNVDQANWAGRAADGRQAIRNMRGAVQTEILEIMTELQKEREQLRERVEFLESPPRGYPEGTSAIIHLMEAPKGVDVIRVMWAMDREMERLQNENEELKKNQKNPENP